MKWLISAALLAVASVAGAQTCDVQLCTASFISATQEKIGDGCINWYNLPAGKDAKKDPNNGPNFLNGKAVKVVDTLAKEDGKGGPVTVQLKATNSCDTSGAPNEVEAQGVTYAGLARVLRRELQLGDELLKVGEGRGAKGQHPWKDK